jgi:hypothetical protein
LSQRSPDNPLASVDGPLGQSLILKLLDKPKLVNFMGAAGATLIEKDKNKQDFL